MQYAWTNWNGIMHYELLPPRKIIDFNLRGQQLTGLQQTNN